jgi:hypothetical protein
VFEKVNGGPLLTRLQEQIHFTEREASQIIRDLASALQFLHVKGEFIRLRLCFMASCGGIEDLLANRTHQIVKFLDEMNLLLYYSIHTGKTKELYLSNKSYLQTCHMKLLDVLSSSTSFNQIFPAPHFFRYCSQGSEAREYSLCLP